MANRRACIGAEVQSEGVHFRVWAPDCHRVEVRFASGSRYPLTREQDGYFSSLINAASSGDLYQFILNDQTAVPDPASRFQPQGPHGPSQIIDPDQFDWTDAEWRGRDLSELVIYEMHIGTFTTEGNWISAIHELKELAQLGITCLEVMPVAEFPGQFGWGYDGVDLFAPTRLYGTPDHFRSFIDAAHQLQIAVILDVVYNHVGPDGNYLGEFARAYFTDRYETDWGAAINFDGENSGPVREFFLTNAAYWIREFHLDGLRLDATQNIYDDSPANRHILTQIGQAVRTAASNRTVILIAENEPQHPELCRSIENGGYGLDAVWNDDFHHSAMVALTGHHEAYYTDYAGSPQEFVSTAKYGYLYQGQWYRWQDKPRGHPGLDIPPSAFISFLQNHDQIANSGRGWRVHQLTSPARYRAMMALTLLMSETPMLFQGQEFTASSPFLFFADHKPELASKVQAGRAEFLSQFPRLKDQRMKAHFAVPHDRRTFERCKLDFRERQTNSTEYQLTHDLLALRKSLAKRPRSGSRAVDGAVMGPQAFLLRYFAQAADDWLLLVNLGPDLDLSVLPEPLLAPPADQHWEILLSTEDPKYDGQGTRQVEGDAGGWFLGAEMAIVISAKPGMKVPAQTHGDVTK